MSEEDTAALLDYMQVALICGCVLFIGITIGMYVERVFIWQSKIGAKSSSGTSAEEQKALLNKPEKVPRHIAVIMDGNRRFGRQNHSDPLQGHWAGGQTLVDFVQWCIADGVEIATVYAFSTENWNREAVEVVTLMTIFSKYAETFKKEALVNNVKIIVLSTNYNMLPLKVQQSVEDLQFSTKQCTGFTLNICLSYGSRSEIVDGCKFLAEKAVAGEIKPSDITESVFGSVLLTKGQPEPDVLIRTSGEYRLSNYLLWQAAYTELFFVDKFWPEFTQNDLRLIMHQYSSRNRRFGK